MSTDGSAIGGRAPRSAPPPARSAASTSPAHAAAARKRGPASAGAPDSNNAGQLTASWVVPDPTSHPGFVTNVALCATMKHMSEVGIRALKQNASAVVADAASGETVTITDRGRPVARMTAIPSSRLAALIDAGRARPARRSIADLPAPEPGPALSAALAEMREAERD